jgi:hypothetical protein
MVYADVNVLENFIRHAAKRIQHANYRPDPYDEFPGGFGRSRNLFPKFGSRC